MERLRTQIRGRLTALPVYYGWLVASVCFVCSLLTFGTVYSFGVLLDPILTDFDRSYGGTSAMFSVQSVVTFGSAALLGIVIDRHGVQRLMAVGTALVVGGLLLASRAQTFPMVVAAYGIVSAAGFGTIFVISYATPSRWFTRHRGLATAFATSGTGIGIVVVPPVVSTLLPRIGWRGGYVTLAGSFLVVYSVAWVVLEDRPGDVGALAKDVERPAESRSLRERVRAVCRIGWSPSFILLFTAVLFAFAPAYVMLVHAVEHTSQAGIGRGVGIVAISLMGGMNVVGKFVVGPLADRAGTLRTMALCAMCTGTGGIATPLVGEPWTFLGITALLGFGYGGMGALLSPAIAEMFGTLNINALFGLVATSFAITGSVVPYLSGAGFDVVGTFTPAFLIAGGAGWAAVGLFLAADGG